MERKQSGIIVVPKYSGEHHYRYMVAVQNGLKSAGKTPKVRLQLKGDQGVSPEYNLNEHGKKHNFLGVGQKNWFLLYTKESLGKLKNVVVNISGRPGAQWNMLDITVYDTVSGCESHFSSNGCLTVGYTTLESCKNSRFGLQTCLLYMWSCHGWTRCSSLKLAPVLLWFNSTLNYMFANMLLTSTLLSAVGVIQLDRDIFLSSLLVNIGTFLVNGTYDVAMYNIRCYDREDTGDTTVLQNLEDEPQYDDICTISDGFQQVVHGSVETMMKQVAYDFEKGYDLARAHVEHQAMAQIEEMVAKENLVVKEDMVAMGDVDSKKEKTPSYNSTPSSSALSTSSIILQMPEVSREKNNCIASEFFTYAPPPNNPRLNSKMQKEIQAEHQKSHAGKTSSYRNADVSSFYSLIAHFNPSFLHPDINQTKYNDELPKQTPEHDVAVDVEKAKEGMPQFATAPETVAVNIWEEPSDEVPYTELKSLEMMVNRKHDGGKLPHILIYPAVILLGASVALALFLTIAYGGELSDSAVFNWAALVGVALLEDLFVFQTLKAVCVYGYCLLFSSNEAGEDAHRQEKTQLVKF
ncbi:uncharacterized protein LOC106177301 [Lingula anatina]|uniref:Uncharacterized protein LOC106177301 n=1 Tax=Lingula anatina TaxID=7574 RepID=A0A1S3JZG8_LINAN|nr:uncharacterized protein LOC106177301 [Lingula anatina]|eukprot:XP_013415494.1 uncharacterized protein LOC106177301 [Lingula anatina]